MLLRRALALSALLAPLCVAISTEGCGTAPLPQDICNWLRDETNCHHRFADDVGTRCADPIASDADPVANSTGYFLDRTDLSICIRSAGGQVIFDPPLDVATFPVTGAAFRILDQKMEACGAGAVAAPQSYAISIEPVEDAAEAGLDDTIVGGTISFDNPEGTPNLNVSCPGGLETYNFNTLVTQKCPEMTNLQPRVILDSAPGSPPTSAGAGTPGFVRLRVFYPPEGEPTEEGATPRVVQYFNCSVPPPPHPCQDGKQNGDETDIDCGGSCSAKCAEGQGCNVNGDCVSNNCGLNGGFLQCLP